MHFLIAGQLLPAVSTRGIRVNRAMPPKHRNSRGKMLQGAAAARAAAPSPKKSKTQLSSVGPSPRVRFNWLRWARAQCEDNKPVEERAEVRVGGAHTVRKQSF